MDYHHSWMKASHMKAVSSNEFVSSPTQRMAILGQNYNLSSLHYIYARNEHHCSTVSQAIFISKFRSLTYTNLLMDGSTLLDRSTCCPSTSCFDK